MLSPLLGNVYLHHALDLWLETEVKPRLRGRCVLVRYADDFVIGFEHRDDAERVWAVLGKRLQRYRLTLHREKTRFFEFKPPRGGAGKGTATFDFLGFTLYWQRTLRGKWRMGCRTRRTRRARGLTAAADWCRRHRHWSVEEQHATLVRKVRGHINYFGVKGNMRSLAVFVHRVRGVWQKWLNRRSQRARMTWKRFVELARRFPLPAPRIVVQIWGT